MSLGAIFDGVVVSLKRAQAQFFLVLENVTAGPSRCGVFKKGEADAGALYASRCEVFQKTFRCLQRQKGDAGAAAFYGGKVSARSCLHGKLTDRGLATRKT